MRLTDAPVPADGHPTKIHVEEGEEAPDFELPTTDGGHRRLSDLRGAPVVLYFYPEDHTPGCTMEARLFRDYFDTLSVHDAAIVGVSRDNQENHCAFRDKHALPFELLSDEEGAVHDLYGAWRQLWLRRDQVKARRCTFLIDPDGHVAKVYPRVNVVGHARTVVLDLEHLAGSWTAGRARSNPTA